MNGPTAPRRRGRVALYRTRAWRSVHLTIGALFVVGVAIAWVAAANSTDLRLADELFKSGVTVAVVTVAGALVTIALRRIEEARAHDAELRRLLHEVLETYNAAKHCRRQVKALGLQFDKPEATVAGHQAERLLELLPEVSTVQLRLEAITRELPYAGLFDAEATARTRDLMRTAEDFINKAVVDRWEEAGAALRAGTATVSQFASLQRFKSSSKRGTNNFETEVSGSLDGFIDEIHIALYGRAPVDGC